MTKQPIILLMIYKQDNNKNGDISYWLTSPWKYFSSRQHVEEETEDYIYTVMVCLNGGSVLGEIPTSC